MTLRLQASPALTPSPSRPARVLAVGLAGLAAAVALSGCSGFKTPAFLKVRPGSSTGKARLPGERIPVLSAIDRLEVNAALKGVGFEIPAAEPVASWPEPGGPPEKPVEHAAVARGLDVAWRKDIGVASGLKGHVTAQPIVADGRLYVMDAQAQVSALDPATGREIWKRQLSERKGPDREAYGGGLAFDGGKVFVTSGYRFVAALDAKSGAVLWRRTVETPLHAAPSVLDGRVYVTDVDDELLTYDATNGTPGWTYQALQEPARMLVASSVTVSGDVVVAPFASGELTALNTANGSELWSYVLSLTNRNNALSEIRDIAGRPLIYRGDVLAGSHSGVFAAVDLRSGQPRWSLPITTIATPWPAGDVIYVTDASGQVICISREAGQVYWITDLNKGRKEKQRTVYSGPVLASDRLVVVSERGDLVALDPRTGAVTKTVNLHIKQGSTLSPTPAEGMLYIATDAGDVIAVR
jgi:outer membrane protein assembly factor BamB